MTYANNDEINIVNFYYVEGMTGYSRDEILWLVLNGGFPRPFFLHMSGAPYWFIDDIDGWERERGKLFLRRLLEPEGAEPEYDNKEWRLECRARAARAAQPAKPA